MMFSTEVDREGLATHIVQALDFIRGQSTVVNADVIEQAFIRLMSTNSTPSYVST
jgi:hypothetical protein